MGGVHCTAHQCMLGGSGNCTLVLLLLITITSLQTVAWWGNWSTRTSVKSPDAIEGVVQILLPTFVLWKFIQLLHQHLRLKLYFNVTVKYLYCNWKKKKFFSFWFLDLKIEVWLLKCIMFECFCIALKHKICKGSNFYF